MMNWRDFFDKEFSKGSIKHFMLKFKNVYNSKSTFFKDYIFDKNLR